MGCFSWITQNSNRSIIMAGYGTRKYPCRTCYMWDNTGTRWREDNYEGYGEFGGKDFYVLLAEMNREYGPEITHEQKRMDGIDIFFCQHKYNNLLFPNLTDCKEWKWTNIAPESCPEQGSTNWEGFELSSDDEDDDTRTNYFKKHTDDGWPNGETKPVKK